MAGPTKTQGEREFADDILVSGEELRGYTAAEDLTRGEPVAITGNYEVAPATGGGAFVGIALYNVSEGEEVALAGDDCEVRIEASEAISAGDAVTPDGTGAFRHAADGETVGVANEDIGAGDFGVVYLSATTGEVSA